MLEQIKARLERHKRKAIGRRNLISAAVLVPFFYKRGTLFLLLTRRTDGVQRHKGQIAFPGGAREPADKDLWTTALREGEEEIGVKPQDVIQIGLLDDHETISGFRVSPYVVQIPYPYSFQLCPKEIAELIEVPWSFFRDPRSCRVYPVEFKGGSRIITSYLFGSYQIWGATAEIIRGLLSLTGDAD
jgi:8-oxo-dGTP pyrophosphatase MutT (NUDIX family)